jgi:hypothetical protein
MDSCYGGREYMKKEVGTPVIAAIVLVVVLGIGAVGWSMFGPSSGAPKGGGSGNAEARERMFKEHPEYRARMGGVPGSGGATKGQ